MKLRIDGTDYEFDTTWLIEQWQAKTGVFVDPNSAEGKKYADVRIGAKGLLRLFLEPLLRTFAQIFNVPDWRTLKPRRGEDMLQVLHGYMTLVLHAEAQNMTLELRTVPTVQGADHESLTEGGAAAQLALTGATIGPHVLYESPAALPAGSEQPAVIEQPAAPRQLKAAGDRRLA